jgi:hypothetical protein
MELLAQYEAMKVWMKNVKMQMPARYEAMKVMDENLPRSQDEIMKPMIKENPTETL